MFTCEMCFAPQRRALFRHLNFQKWSAPGGFVHVHFEMCFAPQRRALFRHLNFQKCSETQVFCTFWLANVLRATTACNFSSLIWPAGSAPAALVSLLFDPPERQIIGLDDGWPESVEEQGLLLLVWRHHMTKQYIYITRCIIAQVQDRGVCIARQYYTQKLLHDNTLLHRKQLLHTEAFKHRNCYTQKLLHTEALTHRHFHTQTLLHTDAFTLYTRTLLHTDAFTHRRLYTQTAFTHKSFYTQTLLQIGAFTHRSFYTQTLLHTEAFTHRRFYTQTPLHTDTFTHRSLYTQTLLHRAHRSFYTQTLLHTDAFTHRRFDTQHTEALYTQKKSAILPQFLADPPSFRTTRVATDNKEIAILPQFLAIEPRFVRKGCDGATWNRNFTSVFGYRTSFRAKGLRGTPCKSQFYLSFWRSNLISCERVAFRAVSLALPLPPPSRDK